MVYALKSYMPYNILLHLAEYEFVSYPCLFYQNDPVMVLLQFYLMVKYVLIGVRKYHMLPFSVTGNN